MVRAHRLLRVFFFFIENTTLMLVLSNYFVFMFVSFLAVAQATNSTGPRHYSVTVMTTGAALTYRSASGFALVPQYL